MRFRTLTGVQRHRLTNALFVAGVLSALGTVTGSNLLGCPVVSRENRLDDTSDEDIIDTRKNRPRAKELEALEESRFVGGEMQLRR
ncbi:hypothetical protein EV175_002674 [Coemansia sp. RSA 1933]|nr:hypothetical protein EV175_002674 [Coemansia sp. RSA 1933]